MSATHHNRKALLGTKTMDPPWLIISRHLEAQAWRRLITAPLQASIYVLPICTARQIPCTIWVQSGAAGLVTCVKRIPGAASSFIHVTASAVSLLDRYSWYSNLARSSRSSSVNFAALQRACQMPLYLTAGPLIQRFPGSKNATDVSEALHIQITVPFLWPTEPLMGNDMGCLQHSWQGSSSIVGGKLMPSGSANAWRTKD